MSAAAPANDKAAAPAAPHPAIGHYAVENGVLMVGGVPLPRLAARVGTTPFFAYDRAKLAERVALLRDRLPTDVALHYAVKANPFPAVVHHLSGLVDGFDVASAGEMHTALDTGVAAADVSFAGPGKTDAELAQAVAAGITIHVESAAELARIATVATAAGLRPRVALRVNPDFEVKSSGMRMGGGAQQFGIDAEAVPAVLASPPMQAVEFVGFHIFAGSQNLSTALLCDALDQTAALAGRLAAQAPGPVHHLNIGGGFGIPYFPKDQPLDVAAVGRHLAGLMPQLRASLSAEAQVIVELGRFIVGEAGLYVARVIDRKDSRGQVFLVTDGGLHHQLAASGNFGQVLRRNYPVAIGNRMSAPADETASVVGCLCTPLDLLADKIAVPRAEVGDLVVIFQSGAYGRSASPDAFLGHPPAAEILV